MRYFTICRNEAENEYHFIMLYLFLNILKWIKSKKITYRSRRRLLKQKENVNYEEGIRKSDDKDHEYTGIKQQSYDNNASYVVTEETPDNRDHQYTELKVKPDEWTKTDALT